MILSGIIQIEKIVHASTDNFFNELIVGDILYLDIETSGPLEGMTLGYIGMLCAVHGTTAESWLGTPKLFREGMASFQVKEITKKECEKCGSHWLVHSYEPVCANCNGRGMLVKGKVL